MDANGEKRAHKPDLLVLVWVHGFKGNEVTFEGFPSRIVRILEETHPSLHVQSHVFPAYETRGELSAATENFVEWLATKVVELENGQGNGRGAGSARVVLMGHSMGGLLIADATSRIAATSRVDDPMWPNVVATLAFDTPVSTHRDAADGEVPRIAPSELTRGQELIRQHVFKHGLSQAATHVETARSVASSLTMLSPLAAGLGWGKAKQAEERKRKADEDAALRGEPAQPAASSWWSGNAGKATMGLSALAGVAAAAGAAYYRREDFATGWRWGSEHMTFVKNLWDADALKMRLATIAELSKTRNVTFANFYSSIPPTGTQVSKRTFAILPAAADGTADYWRPATNTKAKDEVSAHMGMFNPRTNDGFYDLGLATVRLIAERLEHDGVLRAFGKHDGVLRAFGNQGDAESISEKMGDESGTPTNPIVVE